MASKKVISVNESSLVDLKAELYRKETQLKREKVDTSQPKKAPIWQKKKKEHKRKDGKTENIISTDSSYDKELEKSRLMLEAKSALYNKLSNGEIEVPSDEDEQDGRFLVDFHQKTLPKSVDNEDSIVSSGQELSSAATPEEEWVEYVDSFGRSKTCLRKDLPQMKEKDEKVRLKSLDESKLTLLSDDMRRELIRKKWEQEVEEVLDKPVGPVHYQDVLFNETRDHGVGYYQFSKVEEERQEQQSELNKLRAQTKQQRSKQEKLLEKRKAAMDARLAKIRERKQRKLPEAGLIDNAQENDALEENMQVEHMQEEQAQEEQTQKEQTQKEQTQKEQTQVTTQEISNQDDEEETANDENEKFIGTMIHRIRNKSTKIEKAHLNEWERGKIDLEIFNKPKRRMPSYDPRSERNPDFAPPSFYSNANENKSFAKKTKWKQQEGKTDTASDNVITKTQEPGKLDIFNQQESTSRLIQPEHNLTNKQEMQMSGDSVYYSTQGTSQHQVQRTHSTVQNINPDFHNINVQDTNQDNMNNVQNITPMFHNTLPNLPPPPIHTFSPPNLPPPLLPPPYQLPPQYLPNIPYVPHYPPPLPNSHQYTPITKLEH